MAVVIVVVSDALALCQHCGMHATGSTRALSRCPARPDPLLHEWRFFGDGIQVQ